MLELWGDIGFLVFTLSTTLFTLLYLTLSRWYKSFMGTLIAVFMIGIIFLSGYLSLRIWGVYVPGVEWVRLTMFWVLGLAMLTAAIAFLEIQFGKRGEALRRRLSKRYVDVKERDKTREE